MNGTYFKFLFVKTIKKRPLWITWLLFLLTNIAILIILPAVSRANPLQIWANTTMALCQSMMGMNVALITAILAIHIFREGYEEGTELIVISKPITRRWLVTYQFLVFITICLIANLTSVAISAFTFFIPSMDKSFYWGLVVSMFIGNLVSFALFGVLAMILTSRFAKVGVIVINMLLALIFIIFQVLTLAVFSTPLKSLNDHGIRPSSVIVPTRDTKTGEYTEDHVVYLNTSYEKQLTLAESERIKAIDANGMVDYWKNEILSKDPSKVLNVVDVGNQIALSYMTVGLNDYAYRQAKRNFAFSRFYDYSLDCPASPEIINKPKDQKSMPIVYNSFTQVSFKTPEGEEVYFVYPKEIDINAISNSNTTRLRGYGNKLPVAFLTKADEILSTKDVYFEPEQWVKYSKPFDLIYDNLFEYNYYWDYADEDTKENPVWWSTIWFDIPEARNRFYKLLWSCFTGHSAEAEYFNNDFLKDYSKEYFDIHSVNDLNERVLQLKYYFFFKNSEYQQKAMRTTPTDPDEILARENCLVDWQTTFLDSLLNINHGDNYMMYSNASEGGISFIQPGTASIDLQFADNCQSYLRKILMEKVDKGEMTKQEAYVKIYKHPFSQAQKPRWIEENFVKNREKYLFDSLDKPSRSNNYFGRTYIDYEKWTPYWITLVQHQGHNMNWFYYSTKETFGFWVYAVVLVAISLAIGAGSYAIYIKYDIK